MQKEMLNINGNLKKKKFNQFTFEKTEDVVTDIEKAKSIKKSFVDKVGFEIYSQFYYAFFSCDIEKDITLLRYDEYKNSKWN